MNPEITFENLILLLNTPITQDERSRVFEITMKFIGENDCEAALNVVIGNTTFTGVTAKSNVAIGLEPPTKRGRKSSVADIPVAAPASAPAVVEVQPTPVTPDVPDEVIPVPAAPAVPVVDEGKVANEKVLAIKGLHADRTQANPQDKSVFDTFNKLKTQHSVTGNLNAMVEGKHFDLINELYTSLFPTDTGI